MARKPSVPPEELDQRARELYEKSQSRETVKVIQEIDRRTGNVISTRVIQPTVYKSPESAKNVLKGLKSPPKKGNPLDDIVGDITAIQDFENSSKFTEDEKNYLRKRKAEYESYFDFDTPFDKNLLMYLLLEEMILYRLYERVVTATGKEAEQIDERITKSTKRISTIAGDLKIKRETKKSNKDESGFSKLVKDYEDKQGEMIDQETQERWEAEEQALLSRHRDVIDDVQLMIEETEDDEEDPEDGGVESS